MRTLRIHNFIRLLSAVLIFCIAAAPSLPQDKEDSNPPQAGEDVEISVRTEGPVPEIVHAGEPFTWSIVIRWYGGLEGIDPQFEKTPEFEGVKILTPSTTLRTGSENNRRYAEKIFSYNLMAESQGEAVLGSAAIRYSPGEDKADSYLTTSPTVVEIHPPLFSLSKFLGGLIRNPLFQGFVILLLIIGLSVTLILRNRSKKAMSNKTPVEEKKPCEEALENAHRFRVDGKTGDFVKMLEKAARLALSERFPEENPTHVEGYLDCLEGSQRNVLIRFLQNCEEVKYTPVHPSPDLLNRMEDDVKRLLKTE